MHLTREVDCVLGGESERIEVGRGLVVDPRPIYKLISTFIAHINDDDVEYLLNDNGLVPDIESAVLIEFNYHAEGTTITLTRFDDEEVTMTGIRFRVYNRATETVPAFDSPIYTYHGLDGERAPYDTTELHIHPSVRIIPSWTFDCCIHIKKCIMHDGVEEIGNCAFHNCIGMQTIRLSRSLRWIGGQAFNRCDSLEAVFIPPSIVGICRRVFKSCRNLRLLSLPHNINVLQIGLELITLDYTGLDLIGLNRILIDPNRYWFRAPHAPILEECNNFFDTTGIQRYRYDENDLYTTNHLDVHQSIINFYLGQPLLHRACLDVNITAAIINNFIRANWREAFSIIDHDGMTPLHILATNPYADEATIWACFQANMEAAFFPDNRGNTPMDYLLIHHDVEIHTALRSASVLYILAHR